MSLPSRRLITGADVAHSLEYSDERVFYAPPLYYALGALLVSWADMNDMPSLLVPNPNWEIGWAPQMDASPQNKNVYVRLAEGINSPSDTVSALYLLRLASLGLGAVTILSTHTLARRLWPDHPFLALGAAAFVALNPQFIALSAGVTNDNLLITLCTLFWVCIPSTLQGRPTGRWALPGGLAGLAMLTKQSALLLLPIGLLAAVAQHAPWRKRLKDSGAFLALSLGISGWWYVRGAVLYGDPLGFSPHFAGQIPLPHFGLGEAWTVFRTYWAAFGWELVLVDPAYYWAILACVGVAMAGLAFSLRSGGLWWRLSTATRHGMALLALAFLTNAITLVRWARATGAPYGRLLFPTIAPAAVLTTYGLAQWMRRPITRLAAGALAISAFAFAATVPRCYLAPAFASSGRFQRMPETAQPVNVAFEDGIHLIGYSVDWEHLRPGQPASLTLYWRATTPLRQQYRVWVQLGSTNPTRYTAGDDTWLGGTLYPSTYWEAGETVYQQHRLLIPAWAPAPELYWIRLGLVDESNSRVPQAEGEGDVVSLGPWRLLPSQSVSPPACSTAYHLGSEIQLLGYDLTRSPEQNGLQLTLYWKAEQAPTRDYTVFIHLADEQDHPLGQADAPPREGAYPTSWWLPGQVVPDSRSLSVNQEFPEAIHLRLGMYEPDTLQRLPVWDERGNRVPEDTILLTEVDACAR